MTNASYPIYLFVYGTLKEGGRWNQTLGLQGRRVGTCMLKGFKLGDVSATPMVGKKDKTTVLNYPYMYPSPLSKVKGEIIRIDSAAELHSVLAIESEYTPQEITPSNLFLISGTLPSYNDLIMTFMVGEPRGVLSSRIAITNGTYEWLLT